MGPRSPIIWVGWSVFTIIGNLLMSLLNGQQVRQLQTKFLKLSDNVSDGMSCIAQMGGTVEALSHAVDTFHKVFFRQNKRWDFTLLWDETFADIDNAVSNTMEMVASAAAQTLHPILLMPVDAEKLALQIAGLRHERSLVPIIEDRSASRLQGTTRTSVRTPCTPASPPSLSPTAHAPRSRRTRSCAKWGLSRTWSM